MVPITANDCPELSDPHRLMVLYSAEELVLEPEDTLSFWRRMIKRQCHLNKTLSVHVPSFTRDCILHDLFPTSLEHSIPLLLKDGSVMKQSQLQQCHPCPSPLTSQPRDNDGISYFLSRLMSTAFHTSTPSQQDERLQNCLVSTDLLAALADDLVRYTRSVPDKARVHYVPKSYAESSVEKYFTNAATATSDLLRVLPWEEVLLLLHYMQRHGSVVFSEDNSVLKFIAAGDSRAAAVPAGGFASSLWSSVHSVLGSALPGSSSVAHTTTGSVIADTQPSSLTITAADTWALKLSTSIATLSTRIHTLELRMQHHRTQAARYKSAKDMYMAKLCLAKLLETRKQRDAAAAGLMKLEMLEQNIAECETQKVLISSYQLATLAMKQARVVTSTQIETRTVLQADGTTVTEEVVVGSTTKELTVEDVEDAMAAFEDEVEIAEEISQQLAGGGGDLTSGEEDLAELEAQLEALSVLEDEAKVQGEGEKKQTIDSSQAAGPTAVTSGMDALDVKFPDAPTHGVDLTAAADERALSQSKVSVGLHSS